MIPDELYTFDTYIQENRSFAVYRIPGEDKLLIIKDIEDVELYYDIEDLNNKKGFVIAPFHISGECPVILIRAMQEELPFDTETIDITLHKSNKLEYVSVEKAYKERFNTFITQIREKNFRKLVLSRSIAMEKEKEFSPVKAFLAACRKYIRSYVYLCHTPQSGTWLGSTPEMLLSGEKNILNTVAIAGTQQLQSEELPAGWDDKNLIEQMLVAYYIRTQLASFDTHVVERGPYSVRAGDLAHLRSDYHFSLPDNNTLGSLLKLLHPTPAVSGLPKEEAYDFIFCNEGYNRKYYSGFIGWMDPDAKSDLYVNLRCMNICEKELTLYAGGGLLPSSTLKDEWQESVDKLQTMFYLAKPENYAFK
jgi:isochorismate synthase